MNILEQYNQKTIASIVASRAEMPAFGSGCALRVHIKIIDGAAERVQIFEGVCIARKNRSIGSTFTVKKISYGESVERTFHFYSPRIVKIEVVKRGRVRRSKIYYLSNLTGKAARLIEITENTRNN